ncbi:hypothetical protein [Aureimonas ureilytica]|uniref:hypothetical protein n=1 Tax=Aureimonas ureilytica TaxID=401562 RepID=UPI00037CBD9F|nr:hypothetical protein [Aureimonas ureilytica]
MSDFKASTLLSNLKRIQPKVAVRGKACAGALARQAHAKLAEELKTLIDGLEDGSDLEEIEWFWHAHRPIALLEPVRVSVRVEKNTMPNLPNTTDTSLTEGDLEGLTAILDKLETTCGLRFVPREVVRIAA